MTDVHLINHTHWDREWFLTEEYTTEWIPALIDSLEEIVKGNEGYDYLFDGQTLVIEDLLRTRPEYEERVRQLVSGGQLEIGPCYSQPDWRMVSGELHARNLTYGMGDAEALGGRPDAAWLVDTFGHISQAPQLLAQCGLTSAYVWRGVPLMTPLFRWRGSNGTEIAAIDLFGGYRNLYGISRTPDIAVERLVAEAEKLAPSYGQMPVPLFDGYDLDAEPEDPFQLYTKTGVPEQIRLHESSPGIYAASVTDELDSAPVIEGELNSGKYGSTFPGSLSARTYLKVAHHDAERALHRRLEPLAAVALAAGVEVDLDALERANRELLQNGVHDCICGVSIDQVHERMERSYRRMLEWADAEQRSLAAKLLPRFGDGVMAFSSSAMPLDTTFRADGHAMKVQSDGLGVSPVAAVAPVRQVDASTDRFSWGNDYFQAEVDATGVKVDGQRIARLVVRRDHGDTYSSEPGEELGELHMTEAPLHVDESDIDATVRTLWLFALDDIRIDAQVDIRFDDSPIVDLTIRLGSSGTGFRVDAQFETGVETDVVHASMPFDVVKRTHDDDDLFGSEIDADLAGILMGQRETGFITEFPFHDFVALTDGMTTRAVLAHGPRGYRTTADGAISIALRRSVEWLALTGLKLRSGDAGPAMYVPGARCERTVEHRLGFAVRPGTVDSDFLALNEGFHHRPLVAEVSGTGKRAEPRTFVSSTMATTAFAPHSDGTHATLRLVNTSDEPQDVPSGLQRLTIRDQVSEPATSSGAVEPRGIATVHVPLSDLPPPADGEVNVLTPIENRVGPGVSQPDPAELQRMADRIDALTAELKANQVGRSESTDAVEARRLEHHEYVLDRERLELVLSLELNRRRAMTDEEVSIPDEPDATIATIGADLNELRIKRRIWDYVVQALG